MSCVCGLWEGASAGLSGEREWSALVGRIVQIRRERALVRELLRLRACGALQGRLLCTDRLSSYPKQALKCLASHIASASEGVPDFFCRRASRSPKRSSDTLGEE